MSDDEFLVPLKPCPWCKQTPDMWLPLEGMGNTNGTWSWHIHCTNWFCKMKPKSPSVSIRKTTKKSYEGIRRKLIELLMIWNEGNELIAYEGKLIDIDKIIKEGL